MTLHDTQRAELIAAAQQARAFAYVPYSHYAVGAALLTTSGEVITGCNVENAAYGPSICAERTAVVKAVSTGHRDFSAIAVVTRNAGSPCGICRQVLFEFAPQMQVIIADENGDIRAETALQDLLPYGFGPKWL
ncbi:MAG: cytidine deaminase [Anaerolineales bacterium]